MASRLQTKSSLKSKSFLKAKTGLKGAPKIKPKAKKPKLKSISKLIKKADDWFSWYVRLRDSTWVENGWYGTCITCKKTGAVAWVDDNNKLRFMTGWDNGHFVGRDNYVTRYEEENCNLQCSFRCNKMRSGEYVKYKAALRLKYGDKVPEKLEKMAEKEPSHTFRLTRDYLEQVVSDAKAQISFYETQLSA